jgi:hypothetical protein
MQQRALRSANRWRDWHPCGCQSLKRVVRELRASDWAEASLGRRSEVIE